MLFLQPINNYRIKKLINEKESFTFRTDAIVNSIIRSDTSLDKYIGCKVSGYLSRQQCGIPY